MVDVRVEDHGSVVLLHPLTEQAEEWFDEHIGPDNGFQPWYPIVQAEPRFVPGIIDGMLHSGLTLEVV